MCKLRYTFIFLSIFMIMNALVIKQVSSPPTLQADSYPNLNMSDIELDDYDSFNSTQFENDNRLIYPLGAIEEANYIASKFGLEFDSFSPYGYGIFKTDQPYLYEQALKNEGFFEYGIYETLDDIPNDSHIDEQYGLDLVQAYEAWGINTGEGILISVIDTGIDIDHEDFEGRISPYSYNALTHQVGIEYVNDDYGHGTMVAGVIAANQNNNIGISGIAPSSELLIVKANVPGLGKFNYEALVEAIEYSVDQGAQIINLSLGSAFINDAMKDALDYAKNEGVIVVAASGNYDSTFPMYPASYDSTISVAAVNENKDKSIFSSYNTKVDITAPGSSIFTTMVDNDYGYASGTSLSSPYVAGILALMLNHFKTYTTEEITHRLFLTSQDLGVFGKDIYHGYGLIQAYDALQLSFHTVTFETFDGSDISPIKVPEGKSFQLLQKPILEGYYFNQWYKDEALTIPWSPQTDVITSDTILYAEFIEGEGSSINDYVYTISNDEVIIESYNGTDISLNLPSTIEDHPVTTIAEYAFFDNHSIVELMIPNTIETIESYAFSEMHVIDSIEVGENVSQLGQGVFESNPSLRAISFNGDKIIDLPYGTLSLATSLETVKLPNKLETIGSAAFLSTFSMKEINFPDTLKEIKGSAFFFSGLEHVYLPDSVESIGIQSFERNIYMTEFYIGASLSHFGESSLFLNNNLEVIDISEENEFFVIQNDIIFSRDLKELVYYSQQKTDKVYVMPDNIELLHDGCFAKAKFEQIEFNDTITHIPNRAFYQAENLKSIVLPNNITSAGFESFAKTYRLTSFTFSDDFKIISDEMFKETYSLKEIYFSDNVHTIESFAFAQTGLEEVILPDTITTMGGWTFTGSVLLKSFTFPKNIEVIPDLTLNSTFSIEEIILPETVKTLEENALYLDNFYTYQLPNSIETIEETRIGSDSGLGFSSRLRYLDLNNTKSINLNIGTGVLEYLVIGEYAETLYLEGSLFNNDLHVYVNSTILDIKSINMKTYNQNKVYFYTDNIPALQEELNTANFDYEIRLLSQTETHQIDINITGPGTLLETVSSQVSTYELLDFSILVDDGYMVYDVSMNNNKIPNFNRHYIQQIYEDTVFEIVIKPQDYQIEYDDLGIYHQALTYIDSNAEIINLPDLTEDGQPIIEYNLSDIMFSQTFEDGSIKRRSHSNHLLELHLPNYVEKVPSLYGYTSLKALSLPNHLKEMEGIRGNVAMKELTIPASYSHLIIGDFFETNHFFLDNYIALESLTFEGESLIQLNKNALQNLYSLKRIELPYSLQAIDQFVLENAISLEEIVINNPDTSISSEAFSIYGIGNLYDFWTIPVAEIEVQRNPYITLKSSPSDYLSDYADSYGYVHESINQFKVQFLNYAGEVIYEETVNYLDDASIITLDDFSLDDVYEYHFMGWHDQTTTIDGNRIFRPIYDKVLNTHEVIFQRDDGTEISRELVGHGFSAVEPTIETTYYSQDGMHTFSHWSTSFDEIFDDTIVVGVYDLKPYASFIKLNPGVDTIVLNNIWVDPGVWIDNTDLTVTVEGEVNVSQVGDYLLHYQFTYNNQNLYSIYRYVTVLEPPVDVEIVLNPGYDTILLNTPYIEEGATSNIGDVEIIGDVDITTAGVYEIYYLVVFDNQTFVETRYVTVVETLSEIFYHHTNVAWIEKRKKGVISR